MQLFIANQIYGMSCTPTEVDKLVRELNLIILHKTSWINRVFSSFPFIKLCLTLGLFSLLDRAQSPSLSDRLRAFDRSGRSTDHTGYERKITKICERKFDSPIWAHNLLLKVRGARHVQQTLVFEQTKSEMSP